jgi:5-(carboxyamino)imidazole ribonucleotide mutase
MAKKVPVLMGSDSDLPVLIETAKTLRDFSVPFRLRVLSVHRAPDQALEAAATAREKGFGVIIAAAGGAAHLAGAVAAKTTLPVIGVPIDNGALRGVDALYSIVQMPPGVPVASVAINGARNAALLAIQILALSDDRLAAALVAFKTKLALEVLEKDRKARDKLRAEGFIVEGEVSENANG